MKKRRNKGFTLAEVLITLVIIGVIGALTVPVLIQNTKKEEYVSALKKTYSTLSQAAQAIIAEEGSPKCSDGGWACSSEAVYEQFKKHLHNAKECNLNSGCWAQGSFYYLNGQRDTGTWAAESAFRKLILADGTQLLFLDFINADCTAESHGSNGFCAEIITDINGARKPNKAGYDMFIFVLKENGIYPMGCDTRGYDCTNFAAAGGSGHGCACKVLTEGAINY